MEADQPGQGRKLLLFSDSRQAAAFFAPYLETSYQTIQHRRLILEALSRAAADEAAHVDDVAYHLVRAADAAHVFQRRLSKQERQRQTALWLMTEIVSTDDRQSLEGQGLIRVELGREPSWRLPPALATLGLSDQESWDLLGELTRSLRQQGAVTMPEGVDPRDEQFDPRRGPIYVRGEAAEPKRKVLSWLPTRGVNRRLDYMARLLKALGSSADPRDCAQRMLALPGKPPGRLAGQHIRRTARRRPPGRSHLAAAVSGRPGRRDVPLPAMPAPGLGVAPGCLHHHGLHRSPGRVHGAGNLARTTGTTGISTARSTRSRSARANIPAS